MNDVSTGPESESQAPKIPVAAWPRSREPMVQCPCCAGTGRVGLNSAACQACWMRGVVASWRIPQLLHDMNYWHERHGEPRRETDATTLIPTSATSGCSPSSSG